MSARHPAQVPLAEAISVCRGLAHAQAAGTDYALPAYVWAHAAVGRKDAFANGRRLMPLLVGRDLATQDHSPVPVTATLATTTVTATLVPVPVAELRRAIESAQHTLWSFVENAFRHATLRMINRLVSEWTQLTGDNQPTSRVDEQFVDQLVGIATLDRGFLPSAVHQLIHDDVTSRCDVVRWVDSYASTRVDKVVRKHLGDPMSGSKIREAHASGANYPDGSREDTIARALALDMSSALRAPCLHDDGFWTTPSTEDLVLSRAG